MGWPVIITPRARLDLQSIVEYIAKDNPAAAVRVGEALIESALKIGNFPYMGRRVPELESEGCREVIEGVYRIVYELSTDQKVVKILRFWHGARGTPKPRGDI